MTRRKLLKVAGYGVGSLALSAMLSESSFAAYQKQKARTDPFAPEASALSTQGEARDSPVHGGRALAT